MTDDPIIIGAKALVRLRGDDANRVHAGAIAGNAADVDRWDWYCAQAEAVVNALRASQVQS